MEAGRSCRNSKMSVVGAVNEWLASATALCVRISIQNEGAGTRDRMSEK